MFRTACQRGFLTVFYSVGSKPLEIWEVHVKNGHIARLLDPDIKSMVLDIRGTNVSTSYIVCPKDNGILGISMPFMIMVVKNLKKYFTFEVTILDDTGVRRRFRVSNFQSVTQIMPLSTAMPIGLADGWNQIQFNLSEFTRRAYNKSFVEVQKIKVNANIRLRRIYFAERLTAEEDLPREYRIFVPLVNKDKGKAKKTPIPPAGGSKTNISRTASRSIAPLREENNIKSTSAASIVEIPLAVHVTEKDPLEREKEPITNEAVVEEVEEVAASNKDIETVSATPQTSETTPGTVPGDNSASPPGGVSGEITPVTDGADEAVPENKTPPTEYDEESEGSRLKTIPEE